MGLCHFSLVIVAVLMGMAPQWRLVSDVLFFLTELGHSLFIAERRTLEVMVCAFHLMPFAREDQVW